MAIKIQKKLVQYGAGNIGRGFIGELFSRAGYEVVFIDVQKPVIARLNQEHAYPVRFITDEDVHEIMIEGVRAVDGNDMDAVAREIATADIMATAVGVHVLPHIVGPIVNGLRRRWVLGNDSPFNIMICENKLDADQYLRELFLQALSEEEGEKLEQTVGFVEASIGRMVPVMTQSMQAGNPLRVCVEPYAELPVDGDAIKGGVPDVPGLLPASPFLFYIRRKLFIHNMGHAMTAYLGWYEKDEYIADAIRDPYIRLLTMGAMRQSASALAKEYGIELGSVLDHGDDLIFRFHNRSLGDTTERVGSDPIRKLAEKDRLTGAALLCHQLNLPATYIHVGIAAGLLYQNEKDAASIKIQEEIVQNGVASALLKYCGITAGSVAGGQILLFYEMLCSGTALGEVLYQADVIAR